jgi:hypothetical protein
MDLPQENPRRFIFESQNTKLDKDAVASIVLGVELKGMLARQYCQSTMPAIVSPPQHLKNLIESLDHAVWVSFDYDLVVETVLDSCLSEDDWRYAFQGLFEPDYWKSTKDARHIIVKPPWESEFMVRDVKRHPFGCFLR